MRNLKLWEEYSREDVHDIFSPDTEFTPQSGTWGLHGMIRIPDRLNDWVFFVTFGQEQGDHVFDESVTDDGVLSWQSQPRYELNSDVIKSLISHDDRVSNIHFFLRTKKTSKYGYLGRLGYLTHDTEREKPVYFQWQILDWPAPENFLGLIGLKPLVIAPPEVVKPKATAKTNELVFVSKPKPITRNVGTKTNEFKSRKSPDYGLIDSNNKKLGLEGELLVLDQEIEKLKRAGRLDLAERVLHVSAVEGDGAGYDVKSFDVNGDIKYIEIKTTKGSAQTPFFISPNEVEFSRQHSKHYFLYRLYEFDMDKRNANVFVIDGDLSKQISLTATQYKAYLS